MVSIREGTLRDLCYIAANMRDQDRREINASAVLASMTECGVVSFLSSPDTCWTAWIDGQPVAAFGYSKPHEMQPHISTAWAWGTDRFKRATPALTRFCLDHWPRMMIGAGITRCEVRSIADHDIAHKWLSALRARRECELLNYGTNGETFELWSWLKEDCADVLPEARNAENTNSAKQDFRRCPCSCCQ